jgi:hypothetical protein
VSNGSDLLTGRTYRGSTRIETAVTWQPNTSFRAIASFKYTDKKNKEEFGGEQAPIEDFGAELRYNTAGKGSILVTANRVAITYDGETNSPLGNELLVRVETRHQPDVEPEYPTEPEQQPAGGSHLQRPSLGRSTGGACGRCTGAGVLLITPKTKKPRNDLR